MTIKWFLVAGSVMAACIAGGAVADERPTLANWQEQREVGLRQLEKIVPDVMSVNARVVTPLVEGYDAGLDGLDALTLLKADDDLESIVILRGNTIVHEHYAHGADRHSPHSAQSSTKPFSVLILAKAIAAGVLSTDDLVEDHIAEIGGGFRGRTIADVMAMNVLHEFDEVVGYTAPAGSRLGDLMARDESSFGYRPADKGKRESRREFAVQLGAGGPDGSNENTSGMTFYATINTDVMGWILERALGRPFPLLVRELMHEIGGADPVHMTLDHTGQPIIGAGLVATTRDFARYGMLLRESAYIHSIRHIPGTDYVDGATYSHSLAVTDHGYGHGGWGGQYIFADPETGVVVAVYGGIKGPDPVDGRYFGKISAVITAIVGHYAGS